MRLALQDQQAAMEFLIVRTDGDWFDLDPDQFPEVFMPSSYRAKRVEGWGEFRIEIEGCEISFSYEDPGIQVCFEGPELLAEEVAARIVDAIASQITRITGQSHRVAKF